MSRQESGSAGMMNPPRIERIESHVTVTVTVTECHGHGHGMSRSRSRGIYYYIVGARRRRSSVLRNGPEKKRQTWQATNIQLSCPCCNKNQSLLSAVTMQAGLKNHFRVDSCDTSRSLSLSLSRSLSLSLSRSRSRSRSWSWSRSRSRSRSR
jgi:hypothetical protein